MEATTLPELPQSQTPCLLYASYETESDSDARLYSLAEKRSYKLTLPEPPIGSRDIIGSSNGWLVTADEMSEMHLLNPITREQIALPSVVTVELVEPVFDETGALCKYNIRSDEPADPPPVAFALDDLRHHLYRKAFVFYDTSAKRYIVVLIHGLCGKLSFAWLGDDKWTRLPSPHTCFRDCIYKDDLLYAVAAHGEICAFNLRGPMVTETLITDGVKDNVDEDIYIVQAPCGDLLQVWRLLQDEDGHGGEDVDSTATYETHIGKIDIFKVDTVAKKLVKINSLDDHVLLLAHNQSLYLSAEEYPQLKANCVYFTDDCESYFPEYKDNLRGIGVFYYILKAIYGTLTETPR